MWVWHPDKSSLLWCPLNPFTQFIRGCGLLETTGRFRKSNMPAMAREAHINFARALQVLLLEKKWDLHVALRSFCFF